MLLAPLGCTKGSSEASRRVATPPPVAQNPASANDGARVYITNCSSCHQLDGKGIPGAFPPLAGSALVLGDPQRLIAIVKFGVSGNMRVGGERYDGTMPRWGQLISDDDIAAVVTYIRTAWHNRASPVSLADVQSLSQ